MMSNLITIATASAAIAYSVVAGIHAVASSESAFSSTSFTSPSFGIAHYCFINKSKQVTCIGNNEYKQLGHHGPSDGITSYSPADVSIPTVSFPEGRSVKSFSCGGYHCCSVMDDNSGMCWGNNEHGQIGAYDSSVGWTINIVNVVDFGKQHYPIDFTLGKDHSCLRFDNHKIKCFGRNDAGQLGYEDRRSRGRSSNTMGENLEFVDVDDVLSLHSSSESDHNCAILLSQKLKCWGHNGYAQLGYGDTANYGDIPNTMGSHLTEINLGTESRVKQVTLGKFTTCGLRLDNILKCWGMSSIRHLGVTLSESGFVYMNSDDVQNAENKIKSSSIHGKHICLLDIDGKSVKCFDNNLFKKFDPINEKENKGKLIDMDFTDKSKVKIASLGGSSDYLCAIFSNNEIICKDLSNLNSKIVASVDRRQLTEISKVPTGSPARMPSPDPSNAPTFKPFGPTSSPISQTNSPTRKPSKAPSAPPAGNPSTTACAYTDKKSCKKDKTCIWAKVGKKKQCTLVSCSSALDAPACKKLKAVCKWDSGTSTCNNKQ